ncbi:PLDc_N domain-containing protein [Candidatus Woesearchaeota archaeon]|nr:MAG: PLDc_N domain-containing protein [Candidatus Woesearchaeota archaeon]
MFFNTILGIVAVLAAVWVIYDVIVHNKKLSDGMKLLWIILAVIFNILTAIVYYFIGRNAKNDLFGRKNAYH